MLQISYKDVENPERDLNGTKGKIHNSIFTAVISVKRINSHRNHELHLKYIFQLFTSANYINEQKRIRKKIIRILQLWRIDKNRREMVEETVREWNLSWDLPETAGKWWMLKHF